MAQSAFLKVNPRSTAPHLVANLGLTDGFRGLAREIGKPAASLAIAWLLHQGEHVLPIPGTRSPEHLRELALGASIELSRSDRARVEAALPIGWAHGDRYSAQQSISP